MSKKCFICEQELEVGQVVYRLIFGEYVKGDEGEVYFDEASCSNHAEAHYNCLMSKVGKKGRVDRK